MNLLVCLLVIAITERWLLKKFKAQTVLLLGGLIMMFCGLFVRLYNILRRGEKGHRGSFL